MTSREFLEKWENVLNTSERERKESEKQYFLTLLRILEESQAALQCSAYAIVQAPQADIARLGCRDSRTQNTSH